MYTLDQVESWFYKALEIAPETREQYLKNKLDHDQKLLDAVLEILKHDQADQSLLTRLVDEMNAEAELESDPELDRYEIVEKIAAGGMAIVYKARRTDGVFDQQVAVKVMRSSMINGDTTDRFRQERNVLARLQHSHIAQIFDGGITQDNRPYFVMEYIDGPHLNEYFEQQDLSLKSRLKLFLEICEAVKYAHQNLVIHGDIKPSNILVNERGEIKLTDFGISQLLNQQEDAEKRRLMTPAYASPEQLAGEAIDIRSDVYQLGKVLEDLLPEKESKELLFITRKASAEEVASRYATVSELIADVENFLLHKPIGHYSKSFGYTLGLFIKRNQLPVGLATIAVLLLVASSIWYVVNITKAIQEAERKEYMANQSLDFLVDLFEQSDPTINQGDSTNVGMILSAGEAKINALDDQETKAKILNTLGKVNASLGNFDKADDFYNRSYSIYETQENEADLGTVLLNKGYLAQEKSDFRQSLTYFEKSLEKLESDADRLEAYRQQAFLYETINMDTAILLKNKCLALLETSNAISEKDRINHRFYLCNIDYSRLSGAQKDSVDAVRLDLISKMEQIDAKDLNTLVEMYTNVSHSLQNNGSEELAITFAKRGLDLRLKMYDSTHIKISTGIYMVASAYSILGQYDSAAYYILKSLRIKENWFGKLHPSQLPEREIYAQLLMNESKYEEAEEILKVNVELSKQKYGLYHSATGDNMFWLLQLYSWRREYEKSAELYPLLIEIDSVTTGKTANAAITVHDYAYALLALGQREEAIRQYEKSLEITAFSTGKDSYDYGMSIVSLAKAQIKEDPKKALDLMESGVVTIEKDLPENHLKVGNYQEDYARILEQEGYYEKSNRYYVLAIDNYKVNYSRGKQNVLATLQERYANSLKKQGLLDSAAHVMAQAETNFDLHRQMSNSE